MEGFFRPSIIYFSFLNFFVQYKKLNYTRVYRTPSKKPSVIHHGAEQFGTIVLLDDFDRSQLCTMDRKKKRAAVIAALRHYQSCAAANAQVVSLVAEMNGGAKKSSQLSSKRLKGQGRYTKEVLPVEDSFWGKIKRSGDSLEFLHFLALTRESFVELVSVVKSYIDGHATDQLYEMYKAGPVKIRPSDIKRRKFQADDILSMTLKFLLSKAELKDIHIQFGCPLTCYRRYVRLGIESILACLMDHPRSKVYWDRSEESI